MMILHVDSWQVHLLQVRGRERTEQSCHRGGVSSCRIGKEKLLPVITH